MAIWYITPPGMNPRDVYVPFGVMLGLTAVYALVWTVFVHHEHPFRSVDVEGVLEREFQRAPGAGGHS